MTRSADFAYCWNGMKVDGTPLSIDPYKFVAFAMLVHPNEYLDEESGVLKTTHVELTKSDADTVGDPTLEGAILVTVTPPELESYVESARRAMAYHRQAGRLTLAAKYEQLSIKFEDAKFD